MQIKEFINSVLSGEELNLVRGIESKLLTRKRTETISLIVGVAATSLQLLAEAASEGEYFKLIYLKNFFSFAGEIIKGNFDAAAAYAPVYTLAGLFTGIVAFIIYFLLKRTRFLLKESKEPFRYSFWINPFEEVQNTPPAERFSLSDKDRFEMMHHDLMERLNKRIQRLSLLNITSLSVDGSSLSAHIHIEGQFAVRELEQGEWIIHIIPRVRIGAESKPVTLAHPVKFPLDRTDSKGVIEELNADRYNQLVERVYASIAAEVYNQIEIDIREKINLFPGSYLRAVAYSTEAEDFARSNTIDAYDRAIGLYRKSIRYFDISKVSKLTSIIIRTPLLWRIRIKREHFRARTEIGYAKCLIYRKVISAQTGRSSNPIFEVPHNLEKVITTLRLFHMRMKPFGNKDWPVPFMAFLTSPKDSWVRYHLKSPQESVFKWQRHLLFDALVVKALALHYLGARKEPENLLDEAKAFNPKQSDKNALYLFAKGIIEPGLRKALLFLRRATELAPEFQIAQFSLANFSEMQLRTENDITPERTKSIKKEYERVLEINPGNIAAHSRLGNLYWLLKDFKKAKEKFWEGCELKAIASETFIGELNYGLARIAAEEGCFNDSYDHYIQAVASDPGVGAYSVSEIQNTESSYFDYIAPGMLNRYSEFLNNVEIKLNSRRNRESDKVLSLVNGFVLNDYGNACLNYYIRFGDDFNLNEAVKAFEKAHNENPNNFVIKFNLHAAYDFRNEPGDRERGIKLLEQVVREIPTWQAAVLSFTQFRTWITDELKFKTEEIKRLKSKTEKVLPQSLQPERIASKPGSINTTGSVLDPVPEGTEKVNEMNPIWTKISMLETEKKNLEQLLSASKPAFDIIVKNTKLSSLPGGLKVDDDGRYVKTLLDNKKIQWERLDDYDVRALHACADYLSSNKTGGSLEVSYALCEHILKEYYPENFDLNRIQLNVLNSIIENRAGDIQDLEKKKDEKLETIKSGIDYWLNKDPAHFVSLNWADQYLDKDKRIQYLEKASSLAETQGSSIYSYLMGKIYYESDEPLKSIEHFQKAIRIEAGNAKYYNALGNVYYLMEMYNEAADNYSKAIKFSPDTAVYHSNLGLASRNLKDKESALKAFNKAIKLDGNNAGCFNDVGNIYYESENYAEAARHYQLAIDIDPGTEVYHSNLGLAFQKQSKWELAEKAFLAALELEPGAINLNYLGNNYYSQRRYEDALKYYSKAIEKDPKTAVYHSNLGLAYQGLRRWKEAEEAFSRALDIEPGAIDYNYLGNVFYSQSKYAEALKYYLLAIDRSPLTAVYHSNSGLAYQGLQNWEEAEEAFLKALELDPGNAPNYNYLGNLYYARQMDTEAVKYYTDAIERSPGTAVYYSNLGLAYQGLQKWEESEKAFLKSVEIEPTNAVNHHYLGKLFDEQGMYEHAEKYYAKALELNPVSTEYRTDLEQARSKMISSD